MKRILFALAALAFAAAPALAAPGYPPPKHPAPVAGPHHPPPPPPHFHKPPPPPPASYRTQALLYGDVETATYHARDCQYYRVRGPIAEFGSVREAEEAGYRPCKICKGREGEARRHHRPPRWKKQPKHRYDR